jgi:UDP-N-acetylmuramoyl-L-alanyl-D-glutamate--2,6-diaminopimelate ligase
MEEYYAAKSQLFSPDLSSHGVVWIDDPYGQRLAAETALPVTTVGTNGDVAISDLRPSITGTSFTLHAGSGEIAVRLPLAGAFNVSNAALAAATALHLALPIDAVIDGLAAAKTVSGRFELVDGPWPFSVVVDYAHTPDGIVNAVAAARALTSGRVLVVVGAGGDRDRSKRSQMGLAASGADVVIVTSDNPRSEDPRVIADEVASGVTASSETILDRRLAIASALGEAKAGDIVLVLGKGHETVQEFADRTEPFNDAAVVRQEAARL